MPVSEQLDTEGGDTRFAIVQVPPGLPRLVRLSSEAQSFALLEDVIRAHLSQLFPGQAILDAACIPAEPGCRTRAR